MIYKEFERRVRGLFCPLCCAPLDLEEGEYGLCSSTQYFNAVCTKCSFVYADALSLDELATEEDIQRRFDGLEKALIRRCNDQERDATAD